MVQCQLGECNVILLNFRAAIDLTTLFVLLPCRGGERHEVSGVEPVDCSIVCS
jgi:hypothetical protein